MKDESISINSDKDEKSDSMINESEIKISLDEKRRLKAENEVLEKEITELNEVCYGLKENIFFEQEKLSSLKNEMDLRVDRLDRINKQCEAILNDNNGKEAEKIVNLRKSKMIRDYLDELLMAQMPELSNIQGSGEQETFANLIFEQLNITFCDYISEKEAKEKGKKFVHQKQSFRISNKTTFEEIKRAACLFYGLNEVDNYILTDEAESILINMSYPINLYLRDYSVFNNNFKLISTYYLKNRTRLIKVQENKISQANKSLRGGPSAAEGGGSCSGGYDTSIGKIKSFFNEFSGLKKYLLFEGVSKEVKASDLKKKNDVFSESLVNKIDTSFVMMLILLLFYILTIISIYSAHDIGRDNLKLDFVGKIFDYSRVYSYSTFYQYIFSNFLWLYSKNVKISDLNVSNSEFVVPFFTLNLTEHIKNTTVPGQYEVNSQSFYDWTDNQKKSKNNFFYASSIHMIVNKVKSKPCSKTKFSQALGVNSSQCYEELYSTSTAYKEDLNLKNFDETAYIDSKNILNEITKFKTSEEAGIKLDVI